MDRLNHCRLERPPHPFPLPLGERIKGEGVLSPGLSAEDGGERNPLTLLLDGAGELLLLVRIRTGESVKMQKARPDPHDPNLSGEGGIRTHDSLKANTRFPSARTRPLCDLSGYIIKTKSKKSKGKTMYFRMKFLQGIHSPPSGALKKSFLLTCSVFQMVYSVFQMPSVFLLPSLSSFYVFSSSHFCVFP